MKITVREAEEKDFSQIIDLFREFALFEKLPDKMTNSLERIHKEKDFFNCLVAETEDKIVIGYAAYFFCYYTWTGKSLFMDDLYVKPEYRGQGIGSLLFKRVQELAETSGCHRMRWQVSNWNNPAIDFYKALGAEINTVEQNCDLILKQ